MTAALEGGKWSAARPGRTLLPEKTQCPFVQEAGWAPGPVWKDAENPALPTEIWSPDRAARSESLYRLSYSGSNAWDIQLLKRLATEAQLSRDAKKLVARIWYYHHTSFMEVGHLLTRSGLTYPEVSSKIYNDSFCQLGSSGSLLTYSMVQSPSWEANCFAVSQEIPRISRNPKVHYRTHKRPPPGSILDQPNPVHIPTSHLLEIHLNIIHPSTPRSPQWSPSLRFPNQDPIHPPLLTHTRHVPSSYLG